MGDIAGVFLRYIVTDKAFSDVKIAERNFYIDDLMPIIDGEYLIMQFGKDIAMVSQYSVSGRNFIDVYRLYYGGGPVQYGSYDYIGTVEISGDYFPVNRDSSVITYSADDGVYLEAGEYSIIMNKNECTFKYKYSADSEYETIKFLN